MGTQLEMFDENGNALPEYKGKINKVYGNVIKATKVDSKTAKWITKGTVKKLGIKKA